MEKECEKIVNDFQSDEDDYISSCSSTDSSKSSSQSSSSLKYSDFDQSPKIISYLRVDPMDLIDCLRQDQKNDLNTYMS